MPLYIDGEKMPEPLHNSISCNDEKIWSSNTGRSQSAYMNGSIIEIKKTRSLSFPPLTESELNKLNEKINSNDEWHTCELKDTGGKTVFSFTCYFGTPSYTVYSVAKNRKYFCNYQIDAIER